LAKDFFRWGGIGLASPHHPPVSCYLTEITLSGFHYI
jgi:hypothetical protein